MYARGEKMLYSEIEKKLLRWEGKNVAIFTVNCMMLNKARPFEIEIRVYVRCLYLEPRGSYLLILS